MRHSIVFPVFTAAVQIAGSVFAAPITIESLLNDMTDLARLACLPSPPYTTRQSSSYNRQSKTPDDAEGWFANRDRGHYLREERVGDRTEYVMMDADGPGAIVRIWSADPGGTLRIYLDGSSDAAVEKPMDDLLGGRVAGFPEPIAGTRSRGWNLYFPIPYAKHCKVTTDKGTIFYHVNYRTYAAGVDVRTFAPADLQRLGPRIAEVAGKLRARDNAFPADGQKILLTGQAAPGEEVSVSVDGPKAIARLQVQFPGVSAKDEPAVGRGLVLRMTFDGEQTVECPLGDFFGAAPGWNRYHSLPLKVFGDGKWLAESAWFMPFARRAQIGILNLTGTALGVHATVSVLPFEWTDRSLLLHAKWRIERDLPSRPFSDWTHLDCRGNGRFVGGALTVANPVRRWWGEGDEKIYVDGESFPSHFGTGSEDYYGYAWCCNEPFTHAYHNQPRCDGPGNFGYTSNNRFHILDDIPFTTRFRFDLENWHANEKTTTTRAAVSFWYARPGGTDFFKPITAADVAAPPRMEYVVEHVRGAIEAENFRQIQVPGECRAHEVNDRFSGERHLWWGRGKPGDRLVLGFRVDAAGKKKVLARLSRARSYGRVQLYVNDAKVGEPIDLYAQRTIPTDEIDLGTLDLIAGENRLTAEIVGINEKAEQKYEFGIDYLRLE